MPSVSASLTASTLPFFVATDCDAPEDAARVGVRSSGADGGIDRVRAEVPHGRSDATLRLSRAGGGIGRRARLRA